MYRLTNMEVSMCKRTNIAVAMFIVHAAMISRFSAVCLLIHLSIKKHTTLRSLLKQVEQLRHHDKAWSWFHVTFYSDFYCETTTTRRDETRRDETTTTIDHFTPFSATTTTGRDETRRDETTTERKKERKKQRKKERNKETKKERKKDEFSFAPCPTPKSPFSRNAVALPVAVQKTPTPI